MHNKFKMGQFVHVRGIGKVDEKFYDNVVGKVIERDDFFLDYQIEFSNGTTDWVDEKYLKAIRKYRKRRKK